MLCRTEDGFMTCTNVVAIEINKLRKVNYDLIYKYQVSDRNSKETEKYISLSKAYFSSQKEAWRRFSIPKTDIWTGSMSSQHS